MMRVGVVVISVCTVLGASLSGSNAAAESSGELAGTWSVASMTTPAGQVIEPAQPGIFMFGHTHYSAVYTLGADARPPASEAFSPTPDEMAAQFRRLIVNAGTYTADGSTITFRPLIAKSPAFIGGRSTMGFQLAGDVLTLTTETVMDADGSTPENLAKVVMTLRRLE